MRRCSHVWEQRVEKYRVRGFDSRVSSQLKRDFGRLILRGCRSIFLISFRVNGRWSKVKGMRLSTRSTGRPTRRAVRRTGKGPQSHAGVTTTVVISYAPRVSPLQG